MTSQELNHVDTGSQVCNLVWSASVNELVSTHGYSQNQISVWQYPSMTQIATLTGHTMRVLYLAMSPDGQTIVTGILYIQFFFSVFLLLMKSLFLLYALVF